MAISAPGTAPGPGEQLHSGSKAFLFVCFVDILVYFESMDGCLTNTKEFRDKSVTLKDSV